MNRQRKTFLERLLPLVVTWGVPLAIATMVVLVLVQKFGEIAAQLKLPTP